MKKLLSCEFNMDTACVELKYSDGSMIAIDTIAVENEIADNMYQRSELDYLIYYVTEVPELMAARGLTVQTYWNEDGDDLRGINAPEDPESCEQILRRRAKEKQSKPAVVG